MNGNDAPLWPHHHQVSNGGVMVDSSAEDFSSFLNFNDIQLNLSSAFDGGIQHHDQSSMDTDFSGANGLGGNGHSVDSDMGTMGSEDMLGMEFHDLQLQAQQQHHRHHHQQRQLLAQQQQQLAHNRGIIPPTPSSLDLQTGLPHNPYSQMDPQTASMMMERYNSLRDEQMIFTPLISPAVTPLDTSFHHLPEFAIPGAYFSPLTSPALDAHYHRTHMPNPHMVPSQSQSTSPVDPKESPVINKKASTRRKSTTSRNPARVVRESPVMKPQRKKLPISLAPTPELACALAHQPPTPTSRARHTMVLPAQSAQDSSTHPPPTRDELSNESVSPEPLPEVLMAPPPPRSGSISGVSARLPTNETANMHERNPNGFTAPATPASLMKLQKTNLPTDDIPPISMDTTEFLNREIEQMVVDAGSEVSNTGKSKPVEGEPSTPALSASRTPSLKAAASSGSSVASSRHPSPQNSHTPGSTGVKRDLKSAVRSKRGSVSSSPALQPKISPVIKPLLPNGMSPDASALLLASKSNYQNIVEGNHSQLGLQYPEHLSTNLTSKRTSHKIAEQGRRNRINNALAEIAALLPQTSGSDSAGTASQTSKALTVEMAIDYIKDLKKELADTKGKLEEAEKQLAGTSLET